MSGIKTNGNIISVVSKMARMADNAVSLVMESHNRATVVRMSANSSSKVMQNPSFIKTKLKIKDQEISKSTLQGVQEKLLNQIRDVISEVIIMDASKAELAVTEINRLGCTASIEEALTVYQSIAQVCVCEQSQAMKVSLNQTVQTVMQQVGFVEIKTKVYGNTPTIIARNDRGQTIKTEICENDQGEINIVRTPIDIPENECIEINELINSKLRENGVVYESYMVKKKRNQVTRNFVFSGSNDRCITQKPHSVIKTGNHEN